MTSRFARTHGRANADTIIPTERNTEKYFYENRIHLVEDPRDRPLLSPWVSYLNLQASSKPPPDPSLSQFLARTSGMGARI